MGEPPVEGDPRLSAYKEMQTETRSLLGLLLWVSLAYPQAGRSARSPCSASCLRAPERGGAASVLARATGVQARPVARGGRGGRARALVRPRGGLAAALRRIPRPAGRVGSLRRRNGSQAR